MSQSSSPNAGLVFGNELGEPVLRLPTTAPLAQSAALSGTSATNSVGERSKNGPAGPLAGTGERANLDFIADVVIANSELRKQRLGLM